MATTPTLSDLVTPRSADDVRDRLLGGLQGKGFPTTDWEVGGPERTLVEAEAAAVADVEQVVSKVASGGLLSTASGDWLTLLAHEVYELDRQEATRTVGQVVLTCEEAAGPYTIQAGQLRIASVTGNVYVGPTGTGSVQLDSGASISIEVQSEFTNDSLHARNYNDGNDQLTKLLTPLPGVSVDNSGRWRVATDATSGAVLSISEDHGLTSAASVEVTISTSGAPDTLGFKYKLDSGDPQGPFSLEAGESTYLIETETNSLTLTFSGTFSEDDVYTATRTVAWYTEQGHDEETDEALKARCRERWPALGAVATDDKYKLWVSQTDAADDVTRILVFADPNVVGVVRVYLAGPAGPVTEGPAPSTVATVQDYLDRVAGLTDIPIVASVSVADLHLSGTVYVDAARKDEIEQAVYRALDDYVQAIPIGGYLIPALGSSGQVFWADMLACIGDVEGVYTLQKDSFSIYHDAGGAPQAMADLVMAPTAIAQIASSALVFEGV